MDHAKAMRRRECARDFIDHLDCAIGRERTLGQQLSKIPSAEVSHHQVGPAGFSPIVVDGNDVRMFQPGDELGLGIEAADELGIIGEPGMDNLDRDFPAYLRLERAVYGTEGPLSQQLEHPVPAKGFASELEHRIVREDLLLDALELG
jgi:hypothetical protein